MPDFTLHDAEHLFRVLKLMEKLLTKNNIEKLYVPELMLLILTVFFHDIGMAPDEDTILCWKKYWNIDIKFNRSQEEKEYKEFERFCSARSERIKDIDVASKQGNITLSDTLKQYLITDYIRITHGKRLREIIDKDWNGRIKYRDLDHRNEYFFGIPIIHISTAQSVKNAKQRLFI